MSEDSTIDPVQPSTVADENPPSITVVEPTTSTPEPHPQPVTIDELSTPTPQPVTIGELSTPTPQPIIRPPPSQSFQAPVSFMEAYDCAKLNNSWHKVSSALTIHPDWLTKVPAGQWENNTNKETNFLLQVVDGLYCIKSSFPVTLPI